MTIYVKKGLQRHHISHITLGEQIIFGATPYEDHTFAVNATPGLGGGSVWDYAGGSAASFNASSGAERSDVKLQSAKGSGMGWTLTHQAKGRGYDYSQFKGGRSMATYIAELADSGDSTWANRSGGLVANSIVLHDGVSSRRGPLGEDILTIQSATPDYFLGKLELSQMSYLLAAPANKERYKWWFYCTYGYDYENPPAVIPDSTDLKKAAAQNALGYTFKGTGAGGIADGQYNDPLGGFGYYTDQYTITVGAAMQPRPCNEYHLMANLSTSRVLCEIFRNHVKASASGHAQSIGGIFNCSDVRVDEDLERDVFTINVSGTINSIIQTLAENGVWRTWWDSYCNFHFIPDYYGQTTFYPSLILQEGPSLIGTLEVNTGSDYPIVNRAGVKLTDFASFGDATSDPLTSNVNMALGAVYPPGQPPGGNDISFDNYWGRNTAEQARRLYNRANARTTFRWSNFPYPTLAFGMLNRVAQLTARDPKGNWSFSGKNFVVTEVEINLQDGDRPDGGYYLCSISGIEI